MRAPHFFFSVVVLSTTVWTIGAAPEPGQVTLPTERVGNIFFARGAVNGPSTPLRPGALWFTLDTGANLSVLDPATAQSLHLAVSDAGRQTGVGTGAGATPLGRAGGVSVSVGTLAPFAPATMFVVPVREMSGFLNHRIDGVLGVDFMRRHVVEFNYASGTVVFHDRRAFVYTGYAQVLPIELQQNLLVVMASLTMPDGEQLPVRLLIDTGRVGRPGLNGPYVREHRLVERFGQFNHLALSQGINGATPLFRIETLALTLGDLKIDRPEVDL